MFADSLLRAEQLHLFRLLAWGAASILAGTLVSVTVVWRRQATTLLRQFAIQTAAWGVLETAYVALAWHGLALRDLAGATRLDRHLWFTLGLEIGGMGIGATLVMLGAGRERRLWLMGAGMAVIVQCMALFLIDARLAALISR
ncbi:MAG: hypothetical protein KGL38_00105 [Gemmatimonadota bacterium]|nr:hypothetical protein [Gemmatimonadota bacterium]MDE3173932.1 hypothetical protein [Gemmatimonadota bacterium]